ncbi:putative glutamine amidotransferase-like protein [Gordonia polyisoprenivorans NBRC 16320 = JCM 10675]|uniref:glutamine--fructose-6-phosphate transaminase (isomerizing) n=1 Tax=Gordonia polyisoprenivorans TaxID=84595 RepID=A0A846WV66_9ACTN|nr:glutamine amidotransferase [Gordonia polyisoprenivorans]NKY04806.1 glutamine amidotransferase [Gordonia polyisoprenivorans]OZC33078.1 glutamine amidotransferase [Gordonia polyisoprenivorans]GAB22277.1 putative glutamine amidotransferase-like protein [Gordonia polyisoprenivorans NBRC 16320 = JCM 10675]
MCGIVGLHLRNPDLYPRLGELLTGMLGEMQDRGADSAGIAVYGNPSWVPAGHACVSLLEIDVAADDAQAAVTEALGSPVVAQYVDTTLVLSAPVPAEELLGAARTTYPGALVAGFGSDLTVLKGVGAPRDLTDQWGLAAAQGWQGVGHTRMATESAVTPAGAHPYAVGPEQCLVHNGSFSNHATIRRELRAEGVEFDSENDTEVGARFVAHQLAQGKDVETALKEVCATFDGFYTLVVSNRDSFAVVRDAIACKPAVIAETDDWVAMASEYRALAHLPGVENARIWEPEPEVVYAWTR